MRFDVVSLFPEVFGVVRDAGVTGRAHAQGKWALQAWNPRDYTHDVHRTVDDRPYGGGPGMVMLAHPLECAVTDARKARPDADAPVILMSPAGRPFNQDYARELAAGSGAILVCGRYEGVDQRFIDRCVTHELSLGDFVLSGGEIPAMAVIDAVVRLLPGVLGHDQSATQDSFNTELTGLIDSPHYTRPENYEGQAVPPVLLSGNHAHIARWRRQQSLLVTMQRRPDLIEQARRHGLLTPADEAFLAQHADDPASGPGIV
ncbi:MAG TPA: tRNA (guanosine(37)-N1)-methyltransferase TrmD [Burkholderiaceae bacterium]|nr:tRNA (guanosine(37)-N1)-methyltransferase TrmD [Burkholderiaceae bacterium]